MRSRFAGLLLLGLLVGACGGSDDGGDAEDAVSPEDGVVGTAAVGDANATSATTTAATDAMPGDDSDPDDPPADGETATSTSTADSDPATPDDGEVAGDGEPPVDWLTVANGVTVASFSGDRASAANAVRAVDGADTQIGFATDASSPSIYVFELPAETVFDQFSVPDTRNSPGNTTFFGQIEIAGSNIGPDADFEVLVSAKFDELPADQDQAVFEPAANPPVRWIRVTLSGALRTEPEHDVGRTSVRFSELIGNGVQQEVPLATGFDGVWSLRFADNPDGGGDATELRQDGAVVSGCIGFADVTGSVTGNVARLIGVDVRNERPSVYLLSLSPEGDLRGVESTGSGVFRARVGPIDESAETRCSGAEVQSLTCGSIVYVNFDVNSATIRPDSSAILDDLAEALAELDDRAVTIIGHTSTEGSAEYNQGLSERRAQAVIDALGARGLDPTVYTSEGRGETQTLVSETDEASRALNRRVEIGCL